MADVATKASSIPSSGVTQSATAFDKKLSDKVRSIVAKKRLPSHAVDDVAQEVLTALHRWAERKGIRDREELEKGSHAITRKIASRWWRKTRRQGEDNVGPTDLADEHAHAPDPAALDRVDVDRVLAEIAKLLRAHGVATGEADEMGRRIVDVILELTPEEVAEATGKSYEASKKETQRTLAMLVAHVTRAGFHDIGLPRLLARGGALAGVAMLLLLLVPSGSRLRVQDTVAHWVHPSRPFEYTPKDWSTPRPPDVNDEEIAKLREAEGRAQRELLSGEAALKQEDWGSCWTHAQAAGSGEAARGLAGECETGKQRSMDAKGGGGQRPK